MPCLVRDRLEQVMVLSKSDLPLEGEHLEERADGAIHMAGPLLHGLRHLPLHAHPGTSEVGPRGDALQPTEVQTIKLQNLRRISQLHVLHDGLPSAHVHARLLRQNSGGAVA